MGLVEMFCSPHYIHSFSVGQRFRDDWWLRHYQNSANDQDQFRRPPLELVREASCQVLSDADLVLHCINFQFFNPILT